jgi:hypothetical protein
MTQPPGGGQQPHGWQDPGRDDDAAGGGWSTPSWGEPPSQQPVQPPSQQPVQPPVQQPVQPPPSSAPFQAPSPPPALPGQGGPGWGQAPPPGWGTNQPAWTPTAKVGIVPLRPLGVGEILDGAFQAVRANPRAMIGVSAAVVATVTLISLLPQAVALDRLATNPAFTGSSTVSAREAVDAVLAPLGALLTSSVLTFFAVTVLNALLVVPVSAAVVGRRVSPAEMWQRARGRLLPAIGLALLTFAAVLGLWFVVLVPGIAALAAGQDAVGGLLLFVGIVAGFVLSVTFTVRWALAAPALVLEKASVVTALRRSWRLTRGSFWRVLGIVLLTAIIVAIGQGALSIPFSGLAELVPEGPPGATLGPTVGRLLVSGIGGIVSGAVFLPFGAAASALLYIDLRMRREALDVRLAQSLAAPEPTA